MSHLHDMFKKQWQKGAGARGPSLPPRAGEGSGGVSAPLSRGASRLRGRGPRGASHLRPAALSSLRAHSARCPLPADLGAREAGGRERRRRRDIEEKKRRRKTLW